MHVAHLLRKYNPAEWGGTETAVHGLVAGLQEHGVSSVVFSPRVGNGGMGHEHGNGAALPRDPLAAAGAVHRRFTAQLPIWGLKREQRLQLIALGGNLVSFDLPAALWGAREVTVIHSHTLGRLGAIALAIARRRKLPFLVTIHGGAYDLPEPMRARFSVPTANGFDWGKVIGLLVQAHRLLTRVDAVVTCNPREADLIRQRHPNLRVVVQSHGIPAARYIQECREQARAAFPQIAGREVLLTVGRVDPQKCQVWLMEQARDILQRHPNALFVFAGACTDAVYGERLQSRISRLKLEDRVVFTGSLPLADPRLIGLYQHARAMVLPSVSETFGLVILEAWAAGTPVVASRTTGAASLIQPGQNGWLFDLEQPGTLHQALDEVFARPELGRQYAEAGRQRVLAEFDTTVLAGRMKCVYTELIEARLRRA